MRRGGVALALTLLVAGCSLGTTSRSEAPSGAPAGTSGSLHSAVPIDEAAGGPRGPWQAATLVRVVDGDTIRVVIGGVEERVRYIGINTPELYSGGPETPAPFARAATDANVALLGSGRLILEKDISERDRFGRLLRNVWLERDGTWIFVNLRLVADGFARVSTFPPDVKYVDLLRDAERAAREGHLGLWGSGSS